MRSAGVQAHMDKALPLLACKHPVGKRRLLHTLTRARNDIGLILEPVVEQQVPQLAAGFLRRAGNHSQIFLLQPVFRNLAAELCRRLRRLRENHHTANRLVKPVHRIHRRAKLLL